VTTGNASTPASSLDSTTLDPRRHAFRPDRADAALRGRVSSETFVDSDPAHVVRGTLSMRRAPQLGAMQTSELLYGETVQVFDSADGWCWVQNETDGYVGYVREAGLATGRAPSADHWVSVLRTPVFLAPEVKAPVRDFLTLSTGVATLEVQGSFHQLSDGGWVFGRHLRRLDDRPSSPLEQAFLFAGLPYVWGGRCADGVDCSGLVQLALAACGLAAPRDSDMQEAEIGTGLPVPRKTGRREGANDAPPPGLAREDIVFFPGHVGIMIDSHHLFHATAHSLSVCREPVMTVAARAESRDGRQGILTVRRPTL